MIKQTINKLVKFLRLTDKQETNVVEEIKETVNNEKKPDIEHIEDQNQYTEDLLLEKIVPPHKGTELSPLAKLFNDTPFNSGGLVRDKSHIMVTSLVGSEYVLPKDFMCMYKNGSESRVYLKYNRNEGFVISEEEYRKIKKILIGREEADV